jgi:hypothetical protein
MSWEDSWQEEEEEEEEEEAGTYVINRVCNGVGRDHEFDDYDVLLDNQADVSIVHLRLLREVMQANQTVTVRGIPGKQLVATHTGYLDKFFRVYVSEKAKPNVLSLAKVEDMYVVTYVPGQVFTIHLPGKDVEFKRRGKLYIANFDSLLNSKTVLATVEQNEEIYTRSEGKRSL